MATSRHLSPLHDVVGQINPTLGRSDHFFWEYGERVNTLVEAMLASAVPDEYQLRPPSGGIRSNA
jgi:hypothetical protein